MLLLDVVEGKKRCVTPSALTWRCLCATQGVPKAGGKSGWGKLMASFQSADDMLDEFNFCVSCLGPLGGPRVAAALRKVRVLILNEVLPLSRRLL